MAKKSETLKTMRECVQERFVAERNLDPATAKDLAEVAIAAIQHTYAGDQLYVAVNYAERITARDWEIWEKFTGANHAALARQYDLTERAIYLVIERIRPIAISRVQGNLFEEAA